MKLLLLPIVAIVIHAQVYVSPNGSDRAAGTKDHPLRTLAAARDAVRRLKPRTPVSVFLRGGVYELDETLVFTAADSGTAEAPITYTAYANEKPILSGGRRITGWKRGKDELWTAPASWDFHDLWVNGQRRQRARTPNTGFFEVDGQISFEDASKFKYRATDIRPEWAGEGVEVVSLDKWQSLRMPIVAVDEKTRTVTLAWRRARSSDSVNSRYWIENTLDALDAPGEWFLDRKTGTLYYRPLPGEDITRAEAIAPHLEQLVRMDGAHHITLRGIEFRYADWSIDPNGYISIQASADNPAAVMAAGVRYVSIENCTFTRLGQFAVAFGKGSKDNRITGSELFDLGAGGIKIGDAQSDAHGSEPRPDGKQSMSPGGEIRQGPGYPHNAEETSSRNVIADNHIHHIGNTFPTAVGVWIGQSDGNLVSHNEVDNTYYSGISVGWTWGWGPTAAHDNLIEFNHIHDIGRGLLSDMGCIYTLGHQPGTALRNNLCHDVTRTDHEPGGYGAWGIYLDSASSEILVENNVVYRAYEGGFHNQYGQQNTVRNNIFALGSRAQIWRTRLAPEISFTFEHNIVYWKDALLLAGAAPGAGRWEEGKVKFDSNVYFHASAQPARFGKMTFEEWQQRGQDTHSLLADPKFRDPDHGDFTLAPDSPAFEVGVKPIDLSQVGPRKAGVESPIAGVAGLRLRVADLAKARSFYTGVMGFEETAPGIFRVNGDQSIAFTQDPSASGEPLAGVTFLASGRRGSVADLDGHRIEFVLPSKAGYASRKQVSNHILHVGVVTADPRSEAEFYRRTFGFADVWRGPTPAEFRLAIMRAPGTRGDYLELVQPPSFVPPGASLTHICFDVPDIQQAYQALEAKGMQLRGKPRIATNGHWVFNMGDPNGIRLEFMEPEEGKHQP
jgi:parallel beta-helix repeat protein